MLTRSISALALAAIAGILLTPNAAEAGSRWRLHFFQPDYYSYYPNDLDAYDSGYDDQQDYYYVPRPRRYVDPQESYYEPDYVGPGDEPVYAPPKKKKTAAKLARVTRKPVDTAVVKSAPLEGKTSAALSCDKAGQIISGYGFTGVTPTSCKGQVFAFNATRSGKAYVVKLSAASGELTEVKKVQ